MEKKDTKSIIQQDVAKVIIRTDDEITDVLRKIEQTKAKHIVITFTESSDLLVSPINLKVILDQADENGKTLITQIVQNSVGVRNAKQAGLTVTESPGAIQENLWEEADKNFHKRGKLREEKLKATTQKIKLAQQNSDKLLIEFPFCWTATTYLKDCERLRLK